MNENIFTEIYNKILGLFGQAPAKEETKNTAVNRLRLVLMQDRTNLTPEIMHKMRNELIGVLSKYVELDKEALDLNFEQDGEQMALMLSIPVIRAKDEEEIEKALKESEDENTEDSDNEDDEESENEETEESENSEEEKEEESTSTDEEPEDDTQDSDNNDKSYDDKKNTENEESSKDE